MSFIADILAPIMPKAPEIEIPKVKAATPAPTKDTAAVEKAAQEFTAKQALLRAKNRTVATNPLGAASDLLQTSRKSLLGG